MATLQLCSISRCKAEHCQCLDLDTCQSLVPYSLTFVHYFIANFLPLCTVHLVLLNTNVIELFILPASYCHSFIVVAYIHLAIRSAVSVSGFPIVPLQHMPETFSQSQACQLRLHFTIFSSLAFSITSTMYSPKLTFSERATNFLRRVLSCCDKEDEEETKTALQIVCLTTSQPTSTIY